MQATNASLPPPSPTTRETYLNCPAPENIYDALEWVALAALVGFIVWCGTREK